MSTRTVLVMLQANVAGYMASMRAASAATAQMGATAAKSTASAAAPMKKLGQEARMLPMGLSATTTAMGALAVGAAASAKAAIDWDSAWAGVTKTVEGSPQQMAALEQELRGLAKTLPATHEEIAGVAEAAGQLGIERENVASFTKTMIDLGETTNLSADQAATSLARFMNVMGTSQSDVSRLGSSVVELGNNFATTESEIVNMATRISGAGAQIGMTEGDVLGLATALSSVGIQAEAGGTAISRVMVDMAKAVDTGSGELQVFAQVAGQSVGDFTAMFRDDAGGAVTAFIEGLGAVQASGQSITPILEQLGFDSVRVSDALRRSASASDLFADAMRTGNRAYEDNVALTDEAAKRYETLAARLDVAKNKAKDAAITIGGPLAESFVAVVEPIADVIEGLDTFNSRLPEVEVNGKSFKLDIFKGALPQFLDLIAVLDEIDIAQGDVVLSGEQMAERLQASGYEAAMLARETGRSASGLDETARSADRAVGSVDDLASSAEDAADELEDMADAMRELGGQTLDAREANRRLEQAVDDARKSLKENGKTLDVNTQKGRDNAAALDAIAVEGKNASAAVLEQTGSQKKANAVMRDARRDFIEAAISMGMSRDRAKELAREVGLIPRSRRTDVGLNGVGQAIADAARVQASLLGIKDRYVNVFVSEVRRDSARASNAGSGLQRKDGGWIGAPRFAPGGWVSGGGTSMSDSVPAWLSRGEFVVNAASAATYAPLLEAINKGRPSIGGDTIIVNATTESIVREIESRQRVRSQLRRRAA